MQTNKQNTFCWINDQHIKYMDIQNMTALPSILKNAGYEKVYRIKSVDGFKKILSNEDVIKNINKTLSKFNFSKSSCVFHYDTDEDIPMQVMKDSIDFQIGLFDDVTITYDSMQIDDVRKVLDYAKKKMEKPLALYIPIEESYDYIEEALDMALPDERIKRIKFKYGKFDTHREKYALLSNKLKDSEKLWHLSFTGKKCNLEGSKNVATEFIAKVYGVDSVCHSWKEKPKNGRTWQNTTQVFQKNKLEYSEVPNEQLMLSYRQQKIQNLEGVEAEIGNVPISNKQSLIQYIQGKPTFMRALTSLGVMPK